ncbi:uncharacterized protein LOC131881371 [Tigriopus californicus]|uniref:uncharacterized protein LOC131881371 n=1 Tax=Tigriopus californicus TaxID=6832 RepID=UPI0027DA841F|nr:uncharacterized protein LOC131881371 [Tigriopus californicus]
MVTRTILNGTLENPIENGTVIMRRGSVLSYRCSTIGKAFFDSESQEFIDEILVTCQENQLWDVEDISYACEWQQCGDPLTPPPKSGLVLRKSDPFVPPEIGEPIFYECEVGGFNFFKHNLGNSTYQLTCGPHNTIAQDFVDWPQCVPNVFCEIPDGTIDILVALDDTNLTHIGYGESLGYSCQDLSKDIHTMGDPVGHKFLEADCLWNTQTLSLFPDQLECVYARCLDIPNPPDSSGLFHVNGTLSSVPIGNHVTLKCPIGKSFYRNSNVSDTLKLPCEDNGVISEPLDWPECRETPFCSIPPMSSVTGISAILIDDNNSK